jgi:DNA-binding CsgD family transcriptional regulator
MKIAIIIYSDSCLTNSINSGNPESDKNKSQEREPVRVDKEPGCIIYTADPGKRLKSKILRCLNGKQDKVTLCLQRRQLKARDKENLFPERRLLTDFRLKQKVLLTRTEKIIMDLLSEGMYYKEIAGKMNRSINTIKSHVFHIYYKLGVRNRVDAIERYGNFRPNPN